MFLNVATFFLLLMFGEGALYAVLLIGAGSLIYDFVVTMRMERREQALFDPAVDELAA